MLFLNNLRTILIDFENIKRSIVVEHLFTQQQTTIKIVESENVDEWVVETAKENSNDRIAFKKFEGNIVPALPAESVIHSFTPTYEFAGAYIKINGDFTTDPSRKTVDLDEVSKKSFNNSVLVIVRLMTSILNGDLTKKGFFTPFVNVQSTDSSRFKSLLFKAIEAGLAKSEIRTRQGGIENFNGIRLKPEWLNYEDYEMLSSNSIIPIPKDLIAMYPELFSFLNSINIKTLNLEEVLQRINLFSISILGCAQIFEKIIKQYRYDLDSNRIEILKTLKIFPLNKNLVRADQIDNAVEINIEFLNYLKSNVEAADIVMFFKKLGIEPESVPEKNMNANKKQIQSGQIENETLFNDFKFEPAIKKWRSAEQNASEYLRSLKAIISVTDVTQANLGYDIEVFLISGKRIYIEVKSVATFWEPFKITNNEYTSAHSYGHDYYLALVINDEPFMIKFIPDPIRILSFEKKCERWSWYCEQYSSALQEVNQLFL